MLCGETLQRKLAVTTTAIVLRAVECRIMCDYLTKKTMIARGDWDLVRRAAHDPQTQRNRLVLCPL